MAKMAIDQAKEMQKLVDMTRRRTDILVKTGMQCAHAGDVQRMEKAAESLNDAVKNPKLPRDFIFNIQTQVREIKLVGYRKFIDNTVNSARHAAQAHDEKRKNSLLKTVMEYLPKALMVGAGEEFRKDTLRVVEIVKLTGTIVAPPEGTVAKPVEKKPPPAPPNRAKEGDAAMQKPVPGQRPTAAAPSPVNRSASPLNRAKA